MAEAKTYEGTEKTVKRDRDKADMVCARISIEPTKNGGFAVDKSYRPKDEKPKKGDACCGPMWVEPDKFAFSSKKELKKFIDESFPD